MIERIITALVLVAVVLSCMFATKSPYPMLILMTLAGLGAGYEWQKLMPKKTTSALTNDTAEHTVNATQNDAESITEQAEPSRNAKQQQARAWGMGGLTAILTLVSLYFFKDLWILMWIASIMIWLVSISWVKRYPDYDGWYNGFLSLLGTILIVSAVTAIFNLWTISPWWLMYAFLLVWGADSGAYFVGRKFGVRKLAPKVSPNKSIEGLIGGLITSCLIICVVSFTWLDMNGVSFIMFLLLSLITVLASVLGDLVESMIKRRADVKDSGRIFPGHGGVLDRVDSLLAATPIFAAGMYVFELMGYGL